VKKVLVLSVALVTAAAIWSGVGAIASPQSKQSSAGIPARVRALEAKVKTLRVQVADLRGKQACLTGLPLSQYGNGTTSGYYFTNDGVTQFLTSALDVTDVGQPPGAYVAKIDAACIGSLRAMSKSSYRVDRAFQVTHALK
jgi:hypothetical protein